MPSPSYGNDEASMRPYPPIPPLETVEDDVLDGGHLWLREYVPGPVMAITVTEAGMLEFATGSGPIDDPPPSLTHAVEHVRRSFDRDRLRAGVEDVTEFVFYGIATRNEGREYEWVDMAPFLGIDIWADRKDRFVPPDVAERVFQTIGLDPLPAFRKEVPARQFAPDAFEIPTSHWHDRPAAGVLVHNKRGDVALHGYETVDPSPPAEDVESIVQSAVSRYADRMLDDMGADVATVDVDVFADRLWSVVTRVSYVHLRSALESDPEAVRSTVGSAVRSLVRTRRSNLR